MSVSQEVKNSVSECVKSKDEASTCTYAFPIHHGTVQKEYGVGATALLHGMREVFSQRIKFIYALQ